MYLIDERSGSVDPIPVGYKPISAPGFGLVSITAIFVIVQVVVIHSKH
ncbi:MAG: hypothetical protein ACXAEU_24720 [Candidatus Hodarchaeales archaeon]